MHQNNKSNDPSQLFRSHSYQPEKAPPTKPKKQHRQRSYKRWALITLAGIVFLLLGYIGWQLWVINSFAKDMFQGNIAQVLRSGSIATDDNGRTNVLVLGFAGEDTDHGGADLTDTLLVMSMHPERDDYLLSVPRDFYHRLSGERFGKINEAYGIGQRQADASSDTDNSGAVFAGEQITEITGLEIHYHLVVDFVAVEEIVDAVGGISVHIESSDQRGLYDPNFPPEEGGPLRLENGTHDIDGQTALRLTRARGSAGGYGFTQSDFDRTRNQQSVVRGIAAELSWQRFMLPWQSQRIFGNLAQHVNNDIPAGQSLRLSRAIRGLTDEQVRSYTFRDLDGRNLVREYTTPDGLAALIPTAGLEEYAEIHSFIDQL